MARSLAQLRAADALKRIRAMESESYGKYVSYVSALPATILNSGLGQAMAQLLAQARGSEDAHKVLHDQVQSWLCEERKLFDKLTDGRAAHQSNLILGIVEGDQKTYLTAQAEALAYLEWLKKFARAFLKRPDLRP